MLQLEFVQRLPDPVWRDIPITALERQLIHTNAFTRLRSVLQMSLAELEYHGATHTRYQHSLGAMHAASLLAELLWPILPEESKSAQAVQALRIALLLHDIGHPPYSHVVEHALLKHPHLLDLKSTDEKCSLLRLIVSEDGYSHEAFSSYIIEHDKDIRNILNEDHRKNHLPEAREIALLARGRANYESLSVFNSLVSGDVDADRVDYILRDSLHCGLSASLDLYHLRGTIRCKRDGPGYTLVFMPEALPFVDGLLLARRNLSLKVHQGRANRIASQMLADVLEQSLIKMTESGRAAKVIDIHTKYSTRDFENFLCEQIGADSLDRILKGQLYNEISTIRIPEMHPVARLNTYKIAALESAVQRLQDKMRLLVNDDTLIVDVVDPKPPSLTMLVADSPMRSTTIFDKHFTAHGIYVDSMFGLGVYLYSKREKISDSDLRVSGIDQQHFDRFRKIVCLNNDAVKDQTRLKTLMHFEIAELCRCLRDDSLRNSFIERDDFLLSILYAIAEEAREALRLTHCWVRGDGDFQAFVRHVEKELYAKAKLQLRKPFAWSEDEKGGYSVECFKVLERLSYMGLVDHVHKVVGHPEGFGSRLDRILTGWGHLYCDEMLGQNLLGLRELVRQKQRTAEKHFKKCAEIVTARKLEYDRVERQKEAEQYRDLVKHIRSSGACPLEF